MRVTSFRYVLSSPLFQPQSMTIIFELNVITPLVRIIIHCLTNSLSVLLFNNLPLHTEIYLPPREWVFLRCQREPCYNLLHLTTSWKNVFHSLYRYHVPPLGVRNPTNKKFIRFTYQYIFFFGPLRSHKSYFVLNYVSSSIISFLLCPVMLVCYFHQTTSRTV